MHIIDEKQAEERIARRGDKGAGLSLSGTAVHLGCGHFERGRLVPRGGSPPSRLPELRCPPNAALELCAGSQPHCPAAGRRASRVDGGQEEMRPRSQEVVAATAAQIRGGHGWEESRQRHRWRWCEARRSGV